MVDHEYTDPPRDVQIPVPRKIREVIKQKKGPLTYAQFLAKDPRLAD
jgi:hypothetical protein